MLNGINSAAMNAAAMYAPGSAVGPVGNASAGSGNIQMPTASDFIRMIIAEVANQDPTSPVKPSEFVGQLAAMAQLQDLSQIRSELAANSPNQLAEASSFIGKTVAAPGTSIAVGADGKTTSIVFTPPASGSYQAVVTNASGAKVATVPLGSETAGVKAVFTWAAPPGTPAGTYTVSIQGPSGAPVSGTLMEGAVQSVSLQNGQVVVSLGPGLSVPEGSLVSVQ